MSAGKLSRLAGFAFVLAAVLGGVGVASVVDANQRASSASVEATAAPTRAIEVIWG